MILNVNLKMLQNVNDFRKKLIKVLKSKENEMKINNVQLSLNLNLTKIQRVDQYQNMLSQFSKKMKKNKIFTIEFDKKIASNDVKNTRTSFDKFAFTSFSKTMLFSQFRCRSNDKFELLSQTRIHDENSQSFNITLSL